MFIRKRDPRYVKEHIDEAKLQASLLAASQSQAARAKANFQETLAGYKTQEWMEAEQVVEEEDDSEESAVEEEFECVACKKVYKNERYLLASTPIDNRTIRSASQRQKAHQGGTGFAQSDESRRRKSRHVGRVHTGHSNSSSQGEPSQRSTRVSRSRRVGDRGSR